MRRVRDVDMTCMVTSKLRKMGVGSSGTASIECAPWLKSSKDPIGSHELYRMQ